MSCSFTIGCISSRDGMRATLPLRPSRSTVSQSGTGTIWVRSRFRSTNWRDFGLSLIDFVACFHVVGSYVHRASVHQHGRATQAAEACAYWLSRVGKRRCRAASQQLEKRFTCHAALSAVRFGKCVGTALQQSVLIAQLLLFSERDRVVRIVCAGASGAAAPEDNSSAPMPWRNRKSAHHSACLLLFWVLCIWPLVR